MISYLVLGYDRPEETLRCLQTLKQHSRFSHQVVFLCNGGSQEQAWDCYRSGLIDRLIVNRRNNGLGYGTADLFRFCDTEYAIYVQNDQVLLRQMDQEFVDMLVRTLKTNQSVGAIGLAGYCAGVNVYSERPHLINVAFYNSIPDKPNGGCGPHYDREYNEGYVQRYFKERGLNYLAGSPHYFADNGNWCLRETPCGGVSRHHAETGQLWWDKLPLRPYLFPDLTEQEWATSIEGRWIPGTVPSKVTIS